MQVALGEETLVSQTDQAPYFQNHRPSRCTKAGNKPSLILCRTARAPGSVELFEVEFEFERTERSAGGGGGGVVEFESELGFELDVRMRRRDSSSSYSTSEKSGRGERVVRVRVQHPNKGQKGGRWFEF